MIENAHIRAERAHILSEYEQGFWEGYEANINQLPEWYFRLAVVRLTARQRGYWLGREIRLIETRKDDQGV